MKKQRFSCMILLACGDLEGYENYEAADIMEAAKIAFDFACELHGIVLQVEYDGSWGPYDFMKEV